MSTVNGPVSSTDNAIARWDGTAGDTIQDSAVIIDDSNNVSGMTTLTLPPSGLKILDNDSSNTLQITNATALTVNRTLTLDTGSTDKSLTISGNATISQDYSATGSPTFANPIVTSITTANTGLHILDTDASHDLIIAPGSNLTADRTLTITTGDANRTLTLSGNFTGSGTATGTNTGNQTTNGTTNRITVASGTGNPVIDIASTYVGQTSITTLGTITTGTWQGNVIGSTFGGAGSVSGILKANGSGTVSAAASGTDYAPATSGTAILKGNGSGGFSSAVSSTDYAPATTGSAILKGNGTGGFSSAVASTDYAPATSGTAILKANGSGGFTNAVAGTDYLAPNGNGSALTDLYAGQVSYDPTASQQATSVDTVQEAIDAGFQNVAYGNVLCPHNQLLNAYASNSTVTCAANSVILFNSAGYARKFVTLSVTVDITLSGAGGLDTGSEAASTWYHIWAIGKVDGTVSAMFSTNNGTPTLPSGYVFKGYIGAVYNNASSNFETFLQRGTEVISTVVNVLAAGTATNFTSINLAAYVPDTATRAYVRVAPSSSSGTNIVQTNIAPAGSGTTANYGDHIFFGSLGAIGIPTTLPVLMITSQTLYYRVAGTNARAEVAANGWSFL